MLIKNDNAIHSCERYLEIYSEFSLGHLQTESINPLTIGLAENLNANLNIGISQLKDADSFMFNNLKKYNAISFEIYQKVSTARKKGGRIFLCGCGATGRLSLAIETIALQLGIKDIISFMAGGDFALIKSVESFEDRMSYGARQLKELGFGENDYLLAITEGGETSFVIGACLEALKLSEEGSAFIFCNPKEQLLKLERFRLLQKQSNVLMVEMPIGAMALSGSTRMQATTAQMFIAAMATLFNYKSFNDFSENYEKEIQFLESLDYNFLSSFIVEEANCLQKDLGVTYLADKSIAISVLTDTTERSPTFSLRAFENDDKFQRAFNYLIVTGTDNSKEAWRTLLSREPRGLNWAGLDYDVSLEEIYKFDLSEKSLSRRSGDTKFKLSFVNGELSLKLQEHSYCLNVGDNMLRANLALKLLLNTHSTALMGLNNRYSSNIMTWVKPSNLKLIDRAIRYIVELSKQNGKEIAYHEVAQKVFSFKNNIDDEESIVKIVYDSL